MQKRKFACNVKAYFLEKLRNKYPKHMLYEEIRKYFFINLSCAELAQRVFKNHQIKYSITGNKTSPFQMKQANKSIIQANVKQIKESRHTIITPNTKQTKSLSNKRSKIDDDNESMAHISSK